MISKSSSVFTPTSDNPEGQAREALNYVLNHGYDKSCERYIIRNNKYTTLYAIQILQRRWRMAEPTLKELEPSIAYALHFNIRIEHIEEQFNNNTPNYISQTIEYIIKLLNSQPQPKFEKQLLKALPRQTFPKHLLNKVSKYYDHIKKFNWPELDQAILNDTELSICVWWFETHMIAREWEDLELALLLKLNSGTLSKYDHDELRSLQNRYDFIKEHGRDHL